MTDENPANNFGGKERIYCNYCKVVTNHHLKATHHQDHYSYFLFWICAGCDTAILEQKNLVNVDDDGNEIYDSEYIPKRYFDNLAEKHFIGLPKQLKEIYREIILAYNDDMPILAAAGLRALIEGICDDKKVGRVKDQIGMKIQALVAVLPPNIVSNLAGFKFLGNAAVHQLVVPDSRNISNAIEVAEGLLNYFYELDYKSSQLPKSKNEVSEKREAF